ncbi:MAG: hypothetical protein K2G83_03320 [Ruminococcus sp.]|nr:hypothetical protein [Ruminococcus sp.]
MEADILKNTEYVKIFWKHDFTDEPRVIIYEVDLNNNRYMLRLIDIYADRTCKNNDDPYNDVIEVLPLENVEEINNGIWGEEISSCLISKEEFEEIWNAHIYCGSLE